MPHLTPVTGPAIVLALAACESTMDEARALARDGAADGSRVVADEQARGRGTKGRPWVSPPGLGLYVSIVVRPRRRTPAGSPAATLLPFTAALAARDALREACSLETELKWPNDLVAGRRKIGGILVESAVRDGALVHAVAGFGINLNHREKDFPEALRDSATSVRLRTRFTADRDRVLDALVAAFERRRRLLERSGPAAIVRDYEDALAFPRGARVRLETAQGSVAGIFVGVEESGWLTIGRDGSGALGPGAGTVSEAGAGELRTVRFADIRALDWD